MSETRTHLDQTSLCLVVGRTVLSDKRHDEKDCLAHIESFLDERQGLSLLRLLMDKSALLVRHTTTPETDGVSVCCVSVGTAHSARPDGH